MTEAAAKAAGRDVACGSFQVAANGRSMVMGESAGLCKLVTDRATGEILGAHLIGPEVSELLPELTLAQANELTVAEIGHNIHAHPTLSEVLMEAAELIQGKAIHI